MAKISYIDNDVKYVKAYIKRDYSDIKNEIKNNLEVLSYTFEKNGKIYGYNITRNSLLSEVYESDFYVVHFLFTDIETLHDTEQESCMVELLNHLMDELDSKKGYYNLKIPANIVDLVRAYNEIKGSFIFCGGTVEQYIHNKKAPDSNDNGLNVFVCDGDYIKANYDCLLNMTYKSFESYQGQYHLSYAISDNAGEIYKSWIKGSLVPDTKDKVIVAEYEGIPIGFVTIAENDTSVIGVLSAVSSEYRQYGAYKAMIAYIINYAYDVKKSFITGTQFDNFIVQGAWNSLGMRPFYSFYNFHIDKR